MFGISVFLPQLLLNFSSTFSQTESSQFEFSRLFSRSTALDGSVSYENLNMDYIGKLCNEGYPQNRVIRALGITKNDLAMARDILKEFVIPPAEKK